MTPLATSTFLQVIFASWLVIPIVILWVVAVVDVIRRGGSGLKIVGVVLGILVFPLLGLLVYFLVRKSAPVSTEEEYLAQADLRREGCPPAHRRDRHARLRRPGYARVSAASARSAISRTVTAERALYSGLPTSQIRKDTSATPRTGGSGCARSARPSSASAGAASRTAPAATYGVAANDSGGRSAAWTAASSAPASSRRDRRPASWRARSASSASSWALRPRRAAGRARARGPRRAGAPRAGRRGAALVPATRERRRR